MKTAGIISIIIFGASLLGCGDKSSSSSYSGPSGFSSEQKDKYNNLSSEGKSYVDQQMKNYDNSRK